MNENNELYQKLISIPLPIGISFYTFQGISLMVDSFKKEIGNNVPSIKQTTLYIAFFPQLVAGPIVKAKTFIPQIELKKLTEVPWKSAYSSIIVGYFLKMFVADNLKNYTIWISYPEMLERSSLDLIFLLYGYSIQIFADFAGYSLIAIGIGQLFGYSLPQNFNFPYISSSFKEFWNRWHISLSTFLKEYLYIPLGGNRKGKSRMYANLIITMALGGLWHGAAWSYVIWGLAHGILLVIERIFILPNLFNRGASKLIKTALVFGCVSLLWLLFKLPNFDDVITFIKLLFQNMNIGNNYSLITSILIYSFPVIVYHILNYSKLHSIKLSTLKLKPYLLALMTYLILTNAGSTQSFIYFQF